MNELPQRFKIGLACVSAAIAGGAAVASAKVPPLPQPGPAIKAKPANLADEAEKAVNLRIILDGTALVPGQSTTLGVSFDIAPKWNLYWRNPGDSGLPITVAIDAPEGITIGEPQWPTPERDVQPGDILDYVYTRRVTLLFPVNVSPSFAQSGASATIKANARWLVCRESCIPGARSVERAFPVATASSPGGDAALFAEARARLPRTPKEQPTPAVSLEWSGRTLRIDSSGAESMTYFPYEGDIQPEDALARGHAQGASLALSYPHAEAGTIVKGVVEVRGPGRTSFHLVESPPAPTGP